MATITTKDGTTIHYKDWGSGQPIVFSHGWPLSADDWDAQMMFFVERGFRVIAHDRRGHGRSGQAVARRLGGGHRLPQHVEENLVRNESAAVQIPLDGQAENGPPRRDAARTRAASTAQTRPMFERPAVSVRAADER